MERGGGVGVGNNFTLSPDKVYNSNLKDWSDLKDFLKARFVKMVHRNDRTLCIIVM